MNTLFYKLPRYNISLKTVIMPTYLPRMLVRQELELLGGINKLWMDTAFGHNMLH